MDFCKDCGAVLNLFGKNTSGLCSACIQHSKPAARTETQPAKENRTDSTDILIDSELAVENDKITIRSKEGWELWSGAANKKTPMADILKSARLIYKIRNKRKKNR